MTRTVTDAATTLADRIETLFDAPEIARLAGLLPGRLALVTAAGPSVNMRLVGGCKNSTRSAGSPQCVGVSRVPLTLTPGCGLPRRVRAVLSLCSCAT